MVLRRFAFFWLLAVVSIGELCAAPATEPGLQYWLKRSVQAAKQLNYQGTLSYAHGGALSTLQLTHVREGDQEWEHLIKLDGKTSEVVRGGGDVIYRNQRGAATRLSNSVAPMARSQVVAAHFSKLSDFYDGSLAGGIQVAGRDAVRIVLKPRDQDRYGYEFYLDKATGLLLKSVMLDENGKPLETASFSEIKIGPKVGLAEYRAGHRSPAHPPASAARVTGSVPAAPATSARVVASVPSVPKPPTPPARPVALDWQLWMPNGFVQIGTVHHKRINGAPVEVATFSDGLSSFSFFSEQILAAQMPAENQRQNGSTALVMRQRAVGDKSYLITVVGELPLSVAQHIADSAAHAP